MAQRSLLANGLMMALLAAAVSGCAPYMKDFYSAAPPAPRVDLVQVTYDVPFRADEQYMSDADGRALDEFMYTVGVDPQQDRVLVLDRDSGSPWAGQRLESVRAYLARRKVPAEAGRPIPEVPPIRDTVTVVVERPIAAALDCPNWTQPRGGNPQNSTHRNFGCADAFNLQQMVSNKRDLVVGRPLGVGADGEVQALQTNRYRADIRVPNQPQGKPLILYSTNAPSQQ